MNARRLAILSPLVLAAILQFCPAASIAARPLRLRSELEKQLQWRSIGPANMGGRIADFAVDPKSPYTFYAALATGGVIKTDNDGVTWTPSFTSESVGSAGAVAVAPADPNTVWVGTGEANGRNSSSWGDGVYKSTDAGKTWKHMGLTEAREIGRIVIDPKDTNVAYVAAAGDLWGPNNERGVYKTEDGGKSWKRCLFIDSSTGAIDLALSPADNHTVYAATYQRRRYPWGFDGFGHGAGIYRSTDAGNTWTHLSSGLPTGQLGRIGLAVCPASPKTVYAVIEDNAKGSTSLFDANSRVGGVFRSDDSGTTWKRQSGTAPRGFYFGQIRVDPTDVNRVYVLGFGLSTSTDGGKHFQSPGYGTRGVHPDLHALWIDPGYPQRMLLGTDGGIYETLDRGQSWAPVNNFPMGEFYEVATDSQQPYWVYGGLQDNGCWAGPSATLSNRGVENSDWLPIGGGDGFYAFADPTDPMIVYSESQNGDIQRLNRHNNSRRSIHPTEPEGQPGYRFNWNTPMELSHFDHDVLYVGGNQLFRYTNHGRDWQAISPDLSKQEGDHITAGGSGAEVYGTIITISESPYRQGEIWVGTDDGNVQLTRDGGQHWTNVTGSLPDHVRNFWVSRVLASTYDPGRAYVAIDGHRSDDLAPYLFVTDDYGQTFRPISSNLPKEGPVQAIAEDPVDPDLLFAGTEFGAFYSLDQGRNWRKLGQGLPTVAVDDLAIQPRDHALVAATHGRSLWILDNIAPLEALRAGQPTPPIELFPMPAALEYRPAYLDSGGPRVFTAAQPEGGAQIVYWLGSLADDAPQITIADAKGKEVAHLTGDRLPGLAHLTWDLHPGGGAAPRRFGGGGPAAGPPPFVKPGVYTVTLTVGKQKQSQKLEVDGDPSLSVPPPPDDGDSNAK